MDKFKSNRFPSFKELWISALLGAFTFTSTRAETADTATFRWERLEISNAARVTVIQGNEFRLWVDGSDWTSTMAGQANGEERGWEIDGEWLRLHKFSAKELKVQQPHLREIRLKGAVALQSEGVWRDDLLRIGISGVGNVSLNLEVQEIMADVNGVGRLSLKGHCSKARIDINGPGIIDAKTFQARQAKIFIDGLGLCKMDVTDSLYAEISGGGSIRYRKEPVHLVNRISGLGSIAAWDNDPSPNIEPEPQAEKPSKERSSPQSGDFWASRKAGEPRRPVMELGLAHWINPLGTSLENRWNATPAPFAVMEPEPEKSWFLNWWTPLQFQTCLSRKAVSIWARGATVLAYQNIRFEDNLVLSKGKDASGNQVLLANRIDTLGSPRFDRSRLENLQLQVPLMINFHNSRRPHKGWHAGGGIVPGIRLWTRALNRYRDDGGSVEMYRTGNFYLNPFSLALRSELGYGRFRMFTQYSLNSMFRSGYGPRINRVDLGITLLSY